MNDEQDLRAHFAHQRRGDHENAPAWCPELLDRPMKRPRIPARGLPVSLATACIITLALFLADALKPDAKLSELPPLLDTPPGGLFVSLEPLFTTFEAPSDFLLPTHLNLHIP